MKKLLLLITFLLISTNVSANDGVSEVSNLKTINITVNGLVCAFCATAIEKKFKKYEGIKDLSVDLDNKLVVLKLTKEQKLSDQEIKKAITESGYELVEIERVKNETKS